MMEIPLIVVCVCIIVVPVIEVPIIVTYHGGPYRCALQIHGLVSIR